MNVRAHMSMLFHLDKCIGCHTCSVACKNLWTDRKGAEYMWWNNVETIPGAGYPTQWQDQQRYRGGWEWDGETLRLRLHSKAGGLMKLFYNPALPELDNYYEPFTFRYQDLFNAPAGDDQPTAIPISKITGEPMEIKTGPNWDDDLGGSNTYAWNDQNFANLPETVRVQMQELERVVFNYLPRICNHCLNPACVAACPSGAIYKRAEDGVVLVNENKCRAWRMCIAACPYKKVYYNWSTGKSEKCILCFPRLETGQATACAHSCVGRIRYLGVLLYDADRLPQTAMVRDGELIDAHRDVILDPFDPQVIEAARANGIEDSWISAAQDSPAYKFVKLWKLALPLHPEYRTIPMMYYIPPLSPIVSVIEEELYRLDVSEDIRDFELFDRVEAARIPIQYLANLFSAGNGTIIEAIIRKLLAVRIYMRRKTVDGVIDEKTLALLEEAGTNAEEVEAIYKLTTQPNMADAFVIPQYHRESAIEAWNDPLVHKGETGLGYIQPPHRGE
ncbi:MAG: nitrate reductase subunit beta [Anaerolineaceae bacterium]|nr:nitrate reductase subunit beta [Anaerolineaceae bacterium]